MFIIILTSNAGTSRLARGVGVEIVKDSIKSPCESVAPRKRRGSRNFRRCNFEISNASRASQEAWE